MPCPGLIAKVDVPVLVPAQSPAVTVTLPAVLPTVTVIEVVPCPDVIIEPEGTVHV